MLFMGPQMVLDLFAQFKQILKQVTKALALQKLPPAPQHSALCYQRLQCNATRNGCGSGPVRGSRSTWELPDHKSHRALSTLQNLDLELRKRDSPEQSLKAATSFPPGSPSGNNRLQRAISRKPPSWAVPGTLGAIPPSSHLFFEGK